MKLTNLKTVPQYAKDIGKDKSYIYRLIRLKKIKFVEIAGNKFIAP